MGCISCGRHFHDECGDPCCCTQEAEVELVVPEIEEEEEEKPKKELTVSAGRKQAARLWPIDSDAACEWQMQANCGGGFVPILGCLSGKQRHIHHGPDKTTLNNARTNISRICTTCHNRWHAKNDPLYGSEKCPVGIQPKEPRPMTPQEMMQRAQS